MTLTGQVVMSVPGGSYRERSFLRAAIVSGSREGQVGVTFYLACTPSCN